MAANEKLHSLQKIILFSFSILYPSYCIFFIYSGFLARCAYLPSAFVSFPIIQICAECNRQTNKPNDHCLLEATDNMTIIKTTFHTSKFTCFFIAISKWKSYVQTNIVSCFGALEIFRVPQNNLFVISSFTVGRLAFEYFSRNILLYQMKAIYLRYIQYRDFMEDINRLKLLLVEKKKTGKWLAEQLGKTPSTISKGCSNIARPDLATLVKVANLLEVDIQELINKTMKW